jgi:hypothetical protein
LEGNSRVKNSLVVREKSVNLAGANISEVAPRCLLYWSWSR